MKDEKESVWLFIIAAAEDAAYQVALEKHMFPLWQQGLLANWQSVQPGEEAGQAFERATLLLLLISADFFASSSCQQSLQDALTRQQQGTAQVIPILLRAVDQQEAPFASLQMLPTNGQPITHWQHQDEAFEEVTKGIRKAREEHLKSQWQQEAERLSNDHALQEALLALEHALHFGPNDAVLHKRKSDLLFALDWYEDALQACEQAIALDAGNASSYQRKGDILRVLKRPEQALMAYEHTLSFHPSPAEASYWKGAICSDLKRYEEALRAYEHALSLGYKHAIVYRSKADALSHLKRYKEALATCEEALIFCEEGTGINADTIVIYYCQGSILCELKRYEEALVIYEKILALAPNEAQASFRKGNVFDKLKLYRAARFAYERALQLDPGNHTYASQGEKLSKRRQQTYDRFCPQCGHHIRSGGNYCYHCRYTLSLFDRLKERWS